MHTSIPSGVEANVVFSPSFPVRDSEFIFSEVIRFRQTSIVDVVEVGPREDYILEVLGYPCVGDDGDDSNYSISPRLVTLPRVKRDEVGEFLLDVIPFPT